MLVTANKIAISSLIAILFFVLSAFVMANSTFAQQRACCAYSGDQANPATNPCTCYSGDTKTAAAYNGMGSAGECPKDANGNDLPGCKTCGGSQPIASACGGGGGNVPVCKISVVAPANNATYSMGQTVTAIADVSGGVFHDLRFRTLNSNGVQDYSILSGLNASLLRENVTCYANGNCRGSDTGTVIGNGTAVVRAIGRVKACPACAPDYQCYVDRTINLGSTTPLACKPGASCNPLVQGPIKVGSDIQCAMPKVSDAELVGKTASYQLECTPYKGTVAQAKVAKSSTTGTFTTYKIPTGVTNLKCSFRYCLKDSKTSVTTCSNWGKAS